MHLVFARRLTESIDGSQNRPFSVNQLTGADRPVFETMTEAQRLSTQRNRSRDEGKKGPHFLVPDM